MPRYDLAIFDFDGTLADSFPWFCTVLNQVGAKFGVRQIAESEIEGLRDLSSRAVIALLEIPMWKLPAIAIHMRKIMADAAIPLFPETAATLARLSEGGVKLALVSSNSEANIRAILGPAADLVDHYACGSAMFGKPAKFRATLKTLGVAANRTIAVGDEVRDIDAAREAGLAAGAVTFGYNSAKALTGAKPDILIDSFPKLAEALLR